jgi:hypothetical protein
MKKRVLLGTQFGSLKLSEEDCHHLMVDGTTMAEARVRSGQIGSHRE